MDSALSILLGRAGMNPHFTPANDTKPARLFFTLAVQRARTANTPIGEKPATDFFRILMFGKKAENGAKAITKGKTLYMHCRPVPGDKKTDREDYNIVSWIQYGPDSYKVQAARNSVPFEDTESSPEDVEDAIVSLEAELPPK